MALEKLTIAIEGKSGKFEKRVEARFNPSQISIQKTAQWRTKPKPTGDTAKSQFTYGEPATLTMELLFDTYEAGTDVQVYTKEIYHLTTVQEHGDLHRPPLCLLEWGTFNISAAYQCAWVLHSLSQKFTLFLSDGTPVRATLGCTFKQWRGDDLEAKLLNPKSADVAKTRVARHGDTLSSIASEEYQDPALWRAIAQANGIDNPRTLKSGQVLAIPALRTRRPTRR